MIAREMEKAKRGDRDPIYIAWDEYNIWYRWRQNETMSGERALEERYNLEDALVIAGFLNAFIRNADIVKMANMAQLVNVIAPIFAEKDGMFRQTIYYPLQLFAQNMYGTSLDVLVDCETYNTGEFYLGLAEQATRQNNVPYLDVSAAYRNGNVVIGVINRHKDAAIVTDLISQEGLFNGEFEVFEVNGPDIKAENDFNKINVETVHKKPIKINKKETFTYEFPPHSFTLLKGKIVK